MAAVTESIYYVGYGSNLLPAGITNYLTAVGDRTSALTDSAAQADGEWIEFSNPLYFAGASKTWGGGVAFVDRYTEPGHTSYGRAYRMDVDQLHTILRRENGVDFLLDRCALREMHTGGDLVLPVQRDPVGYRGKYNLLLRLTQLHGLDAYTLTTAWDLPTAAPAPGYLDRIRTGLTTQLDDATTEAYLAAAQAYRPRRRL